MATVQQVLFFAEVTDDIIKDKRYKQKRDWAHARVSVAMQNIFSNYASKLQLDFAVIPKFTRAKKLYRKSSTFNASIDFRDTDQYIVQEKQYLKSKKCADMVEKHGDFLAHSSRLGYISEKITDCYFQAKGQRFHSIVYLYYLFSQTITEKQLKAAYENPKFAHTLLTNTSDMKEKSILANWNKEISGLFEQLDIELSDSSPILHGRSPDTVIRSERMLDEMTIEFLSCNGASF